MTGSSPRSTDKTRNHWRTRPEQEEALPTWVTPEKLAFHAKVMQQRKMKHQEQAARQEESLKAVEAARQTRQLEMDKQKRRKDLWQAAISQMDKRPLNDALAQALIDKTWLLDEPTREALVQALYCVWMSRTPTPLEEQVFTGNVFATRSPLPYIPNHPLLLVDAFYPRLGM